VKNVARRVSAGAPERFCAVRSTRRRGGRSTRRRRTRELRQPTVATVGGQEGRAVTSPAAGCSFEPFGKTLFHYKWRAKSARERERQQPGRGRGSSAAHRVLRARRRLAIDLKDGTRTVGVAGLRREDAGDRSSDGATGHPVTRAGSVCTRHTRACGAPQ
jgi:hypothetical protein